MIIIDKFSWIYPILMKFNKFNETLCLDDSAAKTIISENYVLDIGFNL